MIECQKDIRGLLDSFESKTTAKHEKAVGAAVGKKNGTRATVFVSMTDKEKARLTEKAQEHDKSLSVFSGWLRMNILKIMSGEGE